MRDGILGVVGYPARTAQSESSHERRRAWGFWIFLGSNLLWIVWGVSANAWALATLQIGLLIMNIRGARKNRMSDERTLASTKVSRNSADATMNAS